MRTARDEMRVHRSVVRGQKTKGRDMPRRRARESDGEDEAPAQRRRVAPLRAAVVPAGPPQWAPGSEEAAYEQRLAALLRHEVPLQEGVDVVRGADGAVVATECLRLAERFAEDDPQRQAWEARHHAMVALMKAQADLVTAAALLEPTEENARVRWPALMTVATVPTLGASVREGRAYLLNMLLADVARRGYQQSEGTFFEKHRLPDGRPSGAFSPVMTKEEYVMEQLSQGVGHSLFTQVVLRDYDARAKVLEALTAYTGVACPDLYANRQCVTTLHGTLNVGTGEWHDREAGPLPMGWGVPALYFEAGDDYVHVPLDEETVAPEVCRAAARTLVSAILEAPDATLAALDEAGDDLEAWSRVGEAMAASPVKMASAVTAPPDPRWYVGWLLQDVRALAAIREPVPATDLPVHLRPSVIHTMARMPILMGLFWTQRISWAVAAWFIGIGLGRLWFPWHMREADAALRRRRCEQPQLDSWQLLTFLWGAAGTGKGVLSEAVAAVFPPQAVNTLQATEDANFALSQATRDAMWMIIHDMNRTTTTFAPFVMNQMADHAPSQQNGKYRQSRSVRFPANLLVCANDLPHTEKNGSLQRRAVPLHFPYTLRTMKHLEVGVESLYLAHLATTIYRILARRIRQHPLQHPLAPPAYREQRVAFWRNTSPEGSAMDAVRWVYGPPETTYVPLDEVKAQLRLRDKDLLVGDLLPHMLFGAVHWSESGEAVWRHTTKRRLLRGVDMVRAASDLRHDSAGLVVHPLVAAAEATWVAGEAMPLECVAAWARASVPGYDTTWLREDVQRVPLCETHEEPAPKAFRGVWYEPQMWVSRRVPPV